MPAKKTTASRKSLKSLKSLKPADIVVGGTYRNAAGSVRRVVSDGDTRRPGASDPDQLQYEVVLGRSAGQTFTMTRNALAKWAVARVDDGATQPALPVEEAPTDGTAGSAEGEP